AISRYLSKGIEESIRSFSGNLSFFESASPLFAKQARIELILVPPFFAVPVFQIHFAYTFFFATLFFCSIHWINSARALAYCERDVLSWMPSNFPIST